MKIEMTSHHLLKHTLFVEKLILPQMTYTVSQKGKVSTCLIYRNNLLGRGIYAVQDTDRRSEMTLILSLPASSEEIADFFAIASKSHAELKFGGIRVSAEQLEDIREQCGICSLQLLHSMMRDILNNDGKRIIFSGVCHDMYAGVEEAEQMWAGTTTDAFRDWMNNLQQMNASVVPVEIQRLKEQYIGVYNIPSSRPLILPRKPILPVKYYDTATGRPKIIVSGWRISFHSRDNENIGSCSYHDFLSQLEGFQYESYDAGRILLHALSEEDMAEMIRKEKFAGGHGSN